MNNHTEMVSVLIPVSSPHSVLALLDADTMWRQYAVVSIAQDLILTSSTLAA
jgi:hypothetical protein